MSRIEETFPIAINNILHLVGIFDMVSKGQELTPFLRVIALGNLLGYGQESVDKCEFVQSNL